MTDTIKQIVEDCQIYWHETGIALQTSKQMAAELEDHLRAAELDGLGPERVVGDDIASFAREWAAEYRSEHAPPLPNWKSVQRRLGHEEPTKLYMWAFGVAAIAVIVAILLTTGEESNVDNEVWRWVWTTLAIVMSIGEIFTAGFFLLPVGIGAGAAAIAAWAGLAGAVQWVAFFGVTAASFMYLRRYMRMQDDDNGLEIGPSRYVGMQATVLETIDMSANTGRIRVQADEWRAITDGAPIEAGTRVEVVELRGTRLVVAPAE